MYESNCTIHPVSKYSKNSADPSPRHITTSKTYPGNPETFTAKKAVKENKIISKV
jgi:hypothetical protein